MSFAKKLQSLLGNSVVLQWLDGAFCQPEVRNFPPPIFLVGCPRVGSTLLYQALTAKYEIVYLSNAHSLFFSEVCLSDRIVRFLQCMGLRYKPSFTSTYGFEHGLLAPSEAGPTFRYWFGEADFDIGSHVTDCRMIRKTLSTLCAGRATPFVAKNLYNSMRLGEVVGCIPEVFFVWIRRDRGEVERSILKMRQTLYGDTTCWASVKVPHWEELMRLKPEEQVARQVRAIEEYIGEMLAGRNAGLSVEVQYAELCRNPEDVVDMVMTSYASASGITVPVRNTFSPALFRQVRK